MRSSWSCYLKVREPGHVHFQGLFCLNTVHGVGVGKYSYTYPGANNKWLMFHSKVCFNHVAVFTSLHCKAMFCINSILNNRQATATTALLPEWSLKWQLLCCLAYIWDMYSNKIYLHLHIMLHTCLWVQVALRLQNLSIMEDLIHSFCMIWSKILI